MTTSPPASAKCPAGPRKQTVIALLDYGSGNLRSVHKALLKVGAQVRIAQRPEEMADARAVVLPGVGAFDDCIQAMDKQGLLEASRDSVAALPLCIPCGLISDANSKKFLSNCNPSLWLFSG